MNMTDLKYGSVVELRNCERYLYNGVSTQYGFIKLNGMSYIGICDYNNDLTNIHNFHQYDIMKVYKDYTLKELLWERKETLKLSDDERVILRNVDKRYKWLARDSDGSLGIYENKPVKYFATFWYEDSGVCFGFNHLFQFIKWDDKEPYLIEDLLNGN